MSSCVVGCHSERKKTIPLWLRIGDCIDTEELREVVMETLDSTRGPMRVRSGKNMFNTEGRRNKVEKFSACETGAAVRGDFFRDPMAGDHALS